MFIRKAIIGQQRVTSGVIASGGTAPEPFGTIWFDDNLASTDYITNGGSTKTFDGDTLVLSNGSANFNDFIKVKGILPKYRYHNFELWKQTFEVTIGTLNSNSFGFGAGIRGQGEGLHNSTRINTDQSGNNNFDDRLSVYDKGGFANQKQGANQYNFVQNTKYWLEFSREKDIYVCNVFDSVEKSNLLGSITVSPNNGYANTNFLWHNTGEWTLNFFGGNATIHSWKVESDAKKNADILWIGDSNTVGFKVGLPNRFISKYNTDNSLDEANQLVLAGIGDRIAQISLMSGLIQEANAQKIVLTIGVNDKRQGRTNAQVQNDWTALANTIRTNSPNSEFICVSPPASNTHDMGFLATHIEAYATTYTLKYVDLYTATKASGSSDIDALYDVGDGLHYNAIGHQKIADEFTEIAF